MTSVDLVIVGAGAAGIGAGLAAQQAGLRFEILEAQGRVGGRAFTDTQSIGLPWDQGCHWLHSASINPLTAVAERLGIAYEIPEDDVSFFDGRWADAEGRAAMLDHWERVIARAVEVGAHSDVPLSEVMPRGTPWDGMVDSWMIHAFAHPVTLVSTGDVARYQASATDEDWPLRDGYGALLARLSEGLPITLSAPVSRIDWGGADIIVTTAKGSIRTRAVLITASTNVLSEGVIQFAPPLPAWKREALEAAPLGAVNKIAVRFTRQVLIGDAPSRFCFTSAADGTAYWLRPYDQPVAIALLGGERCLDLARQGEAASFEYVREQLLWMFGGDVARAVDRVGYAMWTENPYVRGSYAGMLPGKAHLRADLARPVEGRLFFAGEATVLSHFATAHGAFASGAAAVARLRES